MIPSPGQSWRVMRYSRRLAVCVPVFAGPFSVAAWVNTAVPLSLYLASSLWHFRREPSSGRPT